jgi:hypothetical protein
MPGSLCRPRDRTGMQSQSFLWSLHNERRRTSLLFRECSYRPGWHTSSCLTYILHRFELIAVSQQRRRMGAELFHPIPVSLAPSNHPRDTCSVRWCEDIIHALVVRSTQCAVFARITCVRDSNRNRHCIKEESTLRLLARTWKARHLPGVERTYRTTSCPEQIPKQILEQRFLCHRDHAQTSNGLSIRITRGSLRDGPAGV